MRDVIHHWWVFGVRGVLALGLAVGIVLLEAWAKYAFLDAVTVPFLIILLSGYGMLDSLLLIYLAVQFPAHSPTRLIVLTQGVLGVIIGILLLTVLYPAVELDWFLYIIMSQAAITGVFETLSGLRFTSHVREEWTCFAAGAASLGFAVLIYAGFSGPLRHTLHWFLGYALLLGASMGWFSYRLFAFHRHHPTPHSDHGHAMAKGA